MASAAGAAAAAGAAVGAGAAAFALYSPRQPSFPSFCSSARHSMVMRRVCSRLKLLLEAGSFTGASAAVMCWIHLSAQGGSCRGDWTACNASNSGQNIFHQQTASLGPTRKGSSLAA